MSNVGTPSKSTTVEGDASPRFEALRTEQGLPIDQERFPLLTDAVARGLVMAPSVQLPQGGAQPFAALRVSLTV